MEPVSDMAFGSYLRQLRLRAGFGLRRFADRVPMKPSNLCRLEAGRVPPPKDANRLRKITQALGLDAESPECITLNDLASKARPGTIAPDLGEYVATQPGVPLLLRTVRGKRLGARRLQQLAAYIKANL